MSLGFYLTVEYILLLLRIDKKLHILSKILDNYCKTRMMRSFFTAKDNV